MPRWLMHSVLTVFFWGIWGFIPRKLDTMSAEQSQVLSTLGLLPILAVLWSKRGSAPGPGSWSGSVVAFIAGMVGSLGNLFFYRLIHAGQNAATVVPFTSLYPMITVLLAVLILRERISAAQVTGIAVALLSIYFFNVGREEPFSAGWFAFALLPIGLWGVAALLQKVSTTRLSAERSTICFLLALFPLSAVLLISQRMSWDLPMAQWLWGIALGLSLGLGNLTCLAAFAQGGKAAIVSPLTGLYSLVTVLLSVSLLGEKVRPREWAAIALALAAVVALAWERTPQEARCDSSVP
jgi:drug/metabolite transporter (DMT)-like permease